MIFTQPRLLDKTAAVAPRDAPPMKPPTVAPKPPLRSADEAADRGTQTAASLRLVDQIEGQRGDKYTGAEGHDPRDDLPWHGDEPGDERTHHERTAS